MKKEAKTFGLDAKEFTANGRKYIVANNIVPVRYKEYEKLVPSITFGLYWQEVYQQLSKLYAHLNAQRFADGAVVCHNIMNGIKAIDNENRIHPALEMCALFINREDEDQTIYDRVLMLEKIEDWTKEGLDIMSFFRFAINGIQGFKSALIESTKEKLEDLAHEIEKK